jgi:hypothetical protein
MRYFITKTPKTLETTRITKLFLNIGSIFKIIEGEPKNTTIITTYSLNT